MLSNLTTLADSNNIWCSIVGLLANYNLILKSIFIIIVSIYYVTYSVF